MIKLDISIKTAGLADGTYRVRAKGCIAAVLCWANSKGELPDWTPFAYVPITPNGEGQFRAIGYTHISFNSSHGCVDVDPAHNNLYINCGSIRPITLKPDEALQPREWTDGNIVRLELSEKQADIAAISIESGKRISRGYYRFLKSLRLYTISREGIRTNLIFFLEEFGGDPNNVTIFGQSGGAKVLTLMSSPYAEEADHVDTLIRPSIRRIMVQKANQNSALVCGYVFTYEGAGSSCHGAELPLIFRNDDMLAQGGAGEMKDNILFSLAIWDMNRYYIFSGYCKSDIKKIIRSGGRKHGIFDRQDCYYYRRGPRDAEGWTLWFHRLWYRDRLCQGGCKSGDHRPQCEEA